MRRISTILALTIAISTWLGAQQPPSGPATPAKPPTGPMAMLTVDSIMRGPKLVGASPTAVRWSKDSSKIYFTWQKASDDQPGSYVVNKDGTGLRRLNTGETPEVPAVTGRLDRARKRALSAEGGDIVITDVATGTRRVLTRTSAVESNPRWVRNDSAVTFLRDGNLYLMSVTASEAPEFAQLTDVVAAPQDVAAAGAPAAAAGQRGGAGGGGAAGGRAGGNGRGGQAQTTGELTASQLLLQQQNQELIDYLKRQASAQGQRGSGGGRGAGGRGGPGGPAGPPAQPIARFQLGPRQIITDLQLSADEQFVFVGVTERPDGTARNQDVPNYVTRSAYPEMIPGRTNVGDVQPRRLLALLDLKGNKTTWADASAFAGVERKAKSSDPDVARILDWSTPDVSDDGLQNIITVRSQDHKDRWFVHVDPATGKATVLDRLHDDAWIRQQGIAGVGGGVGGGGGAGGGIVWLPDNKRFLFLGERDGYMHVYSLDVTAAAPQAKQLTSGKFEVTNAQLSADRRTLFLTTNEVHPGERHFYTMSVDGGARTKFTTLTGSNEATVSPDEKSLAVIYSYTVKPPELFVMPMQPGAAMTQLTTTPSEEFRNFKWIDPKVITYKARDGQDVYARLMTPEMIGAKRDPKHPAVIFIHGAGYLQEAHKYWSSSYYRENMFNNILASRGYVVLDPDYRASSGYGRDWRTGIYRHMGGKDLDDVVDGAKFLVQTEKVDAKRIGTYGGSYGGFLTLMGMFTTPDVFAAGAALRPVTDWSHYNDGYTSPILNDPQNDLEAYKQSSPIYFAEGLKGRLLICHGMVDTNVFFQDTVRLVQRLIELRKENWEVAPFPVEDHTFTEETSWASEYKRILNLFEETLRK
jgi:dipeptidyl aminopeptidase/acylaminoacyl peptidase